MNEWTNECMNERTNEWTNEWRNDWMIEWANERMNERMKEWTNEWTNERMNERMNESPKEPTNARDERHPRTHPDPVPQPPQTPYHPQGGVIGIYNTKNLLYPQTPCRSNLPIVASWQRTVAALQRHAPEKKTVTQKIFMRWRAQDTLAIRAATLIMFFILFVPFF